MLFGVGRCGLVAERRTGNQSLLMVMGWNPAGGTSAISEETLDIKDPTQG